MRLPRTDGFRKCPEPGHQRRETRWWLLTENELAGRSTILSRVLRHWRHQVSSGGPREEDDGSSVSATHSSRSANENCHYNLAYIHAWHPHVAGPPGFMAPVVDDGTAHPSDYTMSSCILAANPRTTKRRASSGDSRRLQLALLSAILICALLVVLGFAYLIYVLGHPAEEQDTSGEVAVADIQLRITNYNYTQDLQSASNPHYREFTDTFCSMIGAVVTNATDEEELECEVLEISPGSVVVRFVLIMTVHYGHGRFSTQTTDALEVDHLSAPAADTMYELDIMGFRVQFRYVPLPVSTADILATSRSTPPPHSQTSSMSTTNMTTTTVNSSEAPTAATGQVPGSSTWGFNMTQAAEHNISSDLGGTTTNENITMENITSSSNSSDFITSVPDIQTTQVSLVTGSELTRNSTDSAPATISNNTDSEPETSTVGENSADRLTEELSTDTNHLISNVAVGSEGKPPVNTLIPLVDDFNVSDSSPVDHNVTSSPGPPGANTTNNITTVPPAVLSSPLEGSTESPLAHFSPAVLQAACHRSNSAVLAVYGGWDLSMLATNWRQQARCQCPCHVPRTSVDGPQLLGRQQVRDLAVCKQANAVPNFPRPPPRPVY